MVAALDIGAVGYASERQVLDLMGLVSPEILDLGPEMGFQEMVDSGAWLQVAGRERRTGPITWSTAARARRAGTGRTVTGVRFELLDTCIIEGVGLREPQPWTVALYRLVSGRQQGQILGRRVVLRRQPLDHHHAHVVVEGPVRRRRPAPGRRSSSAISSAGRSAWHSWTAWISRSRPNSTGVVLARRLAGGSPGVRSRRR